MNRDLSKLCCWLLANKLSINTVKSKFMVIASPHNMSNLVDKPEIKVLGKSLEQVASIDYLGMTMDQYLRWDKHVGALGKKLKSAVSSVKTMSNLPTSVLVSIYHSLVESKLRYCNTVWGNCNLALKNKLQILQNRAVRVISKNYTLPIEQVFAELNLLNVQQLIDFDSAALIFKAQNGLAPKYISDMFVPSNYIHGHNTRHAMNGLINSHVNSTYDSRCFAQTGSRLWNKIPHYVRTAKNIDTFKTSLRVHYLSHI